jgi:hypothetical protein
MASYYYMELNLLSRLSFSQQHSTIAWSSTVATPLWGKCEDEIHIPKSGNLESFGIPENSELDCKGQTLCIKVFFILLKSSWSANVQNNLAWVIWTSATQVMVERRVGSQTGDLTPDH